jgi:hypothetical protein
MGPAITVFWQLDLSAIHFDEGEVRDVGVSRPSDCEGKKRVNVQISRLTPAENLVTRRECRGSRESGVAKNTYHIINRGNYRSFIFKTAGAKDSFESTLAEAAVRNGWQVLAY